MSLNECIDSIEYFEEFEELLESALDFYNSYGSVISDGTEIWTKKHFSPSNSPKKVVIFQQRGVVFDNPYDNVPDHHRRTSWVVSCPCGFFDFVVTFTKSSNGGLFEFLVGDYCDETDSPFTITHSQSTRSEDVNEVIRCIDEYIRQKLDKSHKA